MIFLSLAGVGLIGFGFYTGEPAIAFGCGIIGGAMTVFGLREWIS